MDRRANASRSIKVDDQTYDIRFNNVAVRIAKNSQVISEFPMHWATTIIAMARGVEGDPFAKA
ncbi:MAG: hypothetical protein N4A61_11210 [Pelagimonas sp.]|jgi:hypothetical protein|nr:hypothetical protein [Pelagimonas sp.]